MTQSIYENHKSQLQAYGAQHGLRGLEGRLERGLDPAGMLAVEETRQLIQDVVPADSYDSLVAFTNELHVGGIWKNAEKLYSGESPEVKGWFLLASACVESNTGDLTEREYLEDFARVKSVLSGKNMDDAAWEMRNSAAKAYDLVPFNGRSIPLGYSDDGFLKMAMSGQKSGVVEAKQDGAKEEDALYFVGSHELDFDSLAEVHGLECVEREDRGRVATFYTKDGKDLVKKLYPGFGIVFGNKEVALELASYSA